MPSHRSEDHIFLALLLDPALHQTVTHRLELSRRKHGFTAPMVSAERLHISLLNFGPYDESVAAKVGALAATVRFPLFEITLDVALSFRRAGSGPCPFVLTGEQGVEGVRAFYAVLVDWFWGDDLKRSKPPSLTPHMTLVWDKKMVPKHALERPLTWIARDFVFIRSYIRQGRHEILGRWPLVAEEARHPAALA